MSRMLPPYLDDEVTSRAEKRLFALLRDDPGTEGWVCLHSLGLSRHVRRLYGEIDFVVIAPGEGIFCLEVKGGRVSRHDGVWSFTNRFGDVTTSTRGPFMQAREGMFSLRGALADRLGGDDSLLRLAHGYGVAFPDISWPGDDPEFEAWQVYDRDHRESISGYVRRLSHYTHAQLSATARYEEQAARPTAEDVDRIVTCLRPDFEGIARPRDLIGDAEAELLRLTKEQFGCLDSLSANPRCLFEGGAGTGKTVLAIEYARRQARLGRRVLFVCYNRLLAHWIESQVEHPDIHVASLFSWYERLIQQSSYRDEFERARQGSANRASFFAVDYPAYALESVSSSVDEQYDTLVCDEGQDMLSTDNLAVLDAALAGGLAGGRWAVFCDPHRQAIYRGTDAAAMGAALDQLSPKCVRYALRVNCRNTRPISEETARLSRFETPPCLPSEVRGASVDYRFYADENQQRAKLKERVGALLEAGFRANQITILSRNRRDRSCLATPIPGMRCGITSLEECAALPYTGPNAMFSTIHAFKGLESPAVIVTDIERLEGDTEASLLYVGMSRARQWLSVLIAASARPQFDAATVAGLAHLAGAGTI